MKIVFLETNTLGNDIDLSIFDKFGEVILYPLSNPTENANRIQEADIIVVNKIAMDENSLSLAKNLKLICLTATGTNNVDFEYTNARGIVVTNVKGYSTSSVVQHTFALFFYVYEKLRYYDDFVKSGEFTRSDIFSRFDAKFNELDGKTWGIIGLGAIGRSVAAIATQFGCKVIYYSTSGKNLSQDYKMVDLDTLLRTSDVISIHAPLTAATQELIGEKEFEKMKNTAVFLNLGRGAIVSDNALANALLSGEIAGAGIDVLAVEPMERDNPLLAVQDSSKLIITPHIGWATVEARSRCVDEAYENIAAYLRGESRNVVQS